MFLHLMSLQTFYRRLNQYVRKKRKDKRTHHTVVSHAQDSNLIGNISSKKLDEITAESITKNEDLNTKLAEINGKNFFESDDQNDDKIKNDGAIGSEDESDNDNNSNDSDDDDDDVSESNDVGEDDRISDRGSGKREYLKAALLAHDIWKDRSFWEQALWQCTVEQVREKGKNRERGKEEGWNDWADVRMNVF